MVWGEKQQILNGWRCRDSEGLCGSCRDTQLSHSYAPSAKRLPFHCKHSKNGKKRKEKFFLVGEMCDFIIASVGFLGCVGESTITWRDKVVEMGLLALWPAFLLCCARSWPTSEPLLLLQLPCWPRKRCFSEIHLLPAFSLFREELSLSLTWLIFPCRLYHVFPLMALWVVKTGPDL